MGHLSAGELAAVVICVLIAVGALVSCMYWNARRDQFSGGMSLQLTQPAYTLQVEFRCCQCLALF